MALYHVSMMVSASVCVEANSFEEAIEIAMVEEPTSISYGGCN